MGKQNSHIYYMENPSSNPAAHSIVKLEMTQGRNKEKHSFKIKILQHRVVALAQIKTLKITQSLAINAVIWSDPLKLL